MSEDSRRSPDELLKGIQKEAAKKARGHLRVFFGMCPGVGKTYAMLRAAQEKARLGVRVFVGYVETHQRAETEALLAGLPFIPRKKIVYKDTHFEEMDLDLILQEKPDLVLVDELAHTNAPTSRHSKRYLDVEEILKAGIDVYTTVNVQHIESRSDLVQQITGVIVRETVPDSFLEWADQIELIDIPPQDLLLRLQEGKIYLGDRAERAAQNFFKEEHLSALRELALRFTAEKVDDDLQGQMTVKGIVGPWNTSERLLVAVSYSPYSERLIRATRRMAYNLEAPWIALYVDSGEKINSEDEERLRKNLALAKELGAEVVTTRDTHVARAIRRTSHERNVTQIIMGRPDRRFWGDLFSRGTLLDQLVRETSAVDVHVIRQDRKPRYRRLRLGLPLLEKNLIPYWYTFCFLAAVSAFNFSLVPLLGYRSVGYLFLVAVLAVSILSSMGPILFAAVLSALLWNFLFIPPIFTFSISTTEDAMMCIAYLAVAIFSGTLANRIRRQEADLIQREYRANILYDLTREIADVKGDKAIANVAVHCVERLFNVKASVLIKDGPHGMRPLSDVDKKISEKDSAVAHWSFENRKQAGWGTETLSSSRCLCLPLIGRSEAIGVLLFYPSKEKRLSLEQENMLETIANHLAVALEREALESQAKNARLLEASERLHQTLLNSVSHELRTPLTSIIGTATALQDADISADAKARVELTSELVDSCARLNRVVENLLDMSRLNSGMLSLKKELIDLNDLASASLVRLKSFTKNHRLQFIPSPTESFIEGDYRLLEHALANLILNAANYSPAGSLIQIKVDSEAGHCRVSVQDEGPGIPEADRQKIFDKFYRVPGTPTGGTGLGLSIVKSIMEAHQGRVEVRSRSESSGAVFSLIFASARVEMKWKG